MKRKPTSSRKGATGAAQRSKAAPLRIKASLELALLGLIAEKQPRSGYDLVQTFRISMVHYWHAHPGQIYPTLDRMERAGWIAGREVIQRGRPNKRVYSITGEGRRVLLEWLAAPYEPFKMKNPPLLKSRFLAHLGADGAGAKFAETRDAMAAYLEELRGYDREFAEKGGPYQDVNDMFVYFTLRRGIEFAQSEVAFCQWAIAEIDKHRNLFGASLGAAPINASARPTEVGRAIRSG
jgi:DNA-binding PadR family transcriptional regulator